MLFSWNPLVPQISFLRGQKVSLELIRDVNEGVDRNRKAFEAGGLAHCVATPAPTSNAVSVPVPRPGPPSVPPRVPPTEAIFLP